MIFSRFYVHIATSRNWIIAAVSAMLFICTFLPAAAQTDTAYFDSLQKRLIEDGFNQETVRALYQKETVQFNFDGVSRFFTYQEGKLNYDQFTEKGPIQNARNYMDAHKASFEHAENESGVEREVITAILLVETRLGEYFGSDSILNTLSTMAALSDPQVLEAFWEKVPAERRLERAAFEKKAKQKSGWAYGELKALLKYTKRENLSPETIVGSFAGAMGIAQFMPSNALSLAVDGNKDGRTDLFDHADAISSVANYLKRHGWKSGLDRDAAYEVILHYNRSSYYANTVLKIVDLLKG